MDLDDALRSLASRQHGTLLRAQARALGLSEKALGHRIRRGLLVPLSPSVLVLGGSPPTRHQLALAAVLDGGTGAALSHDSAAAIAGLPGFELAPPIHVTRWRDRSRRPNRLAVQHSTRFLPRRHTVQVDGISVTTPTRTLFDLAATLPAWRLALLVDRAWSRRLTDWAQMTTMLAELTRRGRSGLRRMRAVLDERGRDHLPPESNLEQRFLSLVEGAGVRGWRRQVQLGDGQGPIGRVDFLKCDLPLVVEIDSAAFHTTLIDTCHDLARERAIRDLGLALVRIREFELWHRPEEVLAIVHSGLHHAARLSTGVRIRPSGDGS